MLDAYLYGGHAVLDFVRLGRVRERPVHLQQTANDKFDKIGRIKSHYKTVSELMTFMDQWTDPKMVREAQVYRPLLVE